MPKKRHVVFHIGLPKSGTTTIQDDLLIPNAEALSAIGIRPFVDRSSVVPQIAGSALSVAAQTSVPQNQRQAFRAQRGKGGGTPELVTFGDFSSYVFKNDLADDELNRLSEGLIQHLSGLPEDRLVFSHEIALWSSVRGYPPRHELGHERSLSRKRAMQARLARFYDRVFQAIAEQVTVVIVLRRQDKLLRSIYNQSIKSTALQVEFSSFVLGEMDLELLDFQNLIHLYRSWMPSVKLEVLFFEDMIKDSLSFLRHFGSIMGPDIRLDDAVVPKRNSSLDWRALEVKRFANQFPWTPEEHQLLRLTLEKMATKECPQDSITSDAEVDEAIAFMFRTRNERLVAWLSDNAASAMDSSLAAHYQWNE